MTLTWRKLLNANGDVTSKHFNLDRPNYLQLFVIVMEDNESGTAMLKSYFNRKSGALNIMVCRLCKKDVKAAKGKSYLSNKM